MVDDDARSKKQLSLKQAGSVLESFSADSEETAVSYWVAAETVGPTKSIFLISRELALI